MMLAAAILVFLGTGSAAFAYNETTSTVDPRPCGDCHYPGPMGGTGTRWGPHGGYSSTTHACDTCHTLHDAPTGFSLLPGETINATCLTCHDGTTAGGGGVYGAIVGRGQVVGATHSIESTSMVPGGNAATGGSAAIAFSGPNSTLTCSDCHSPHGTDCVTPYYGERQRANDWAGLMHIQTQNRLLKRRPGNATTSTADYGSDWCLACHAGRVSGLGLHTHPVESKATSATPYNYRRLPVFAGSLQSSTTVLGPAGSGHTAHPQYYPFLWPYPRTPLQAGTYPICQQCHEDTRNVGLLVADGTEALPQPHIITTADGRTSTDNPQFQNFPHETTGYRMLVEATTTAYTDDLCTNCHTGAQLP